jgi:Holliday junction resolvase RusA-like endonuclease
MKTDKPTGTSLSVIRQKTETETGTTYLCFGCGKEGGSKVAPSYPSIKRNFPSHSAERLPNMSFFHAFTPPRATAQQRRHCSNGATFLPQRASLASATLRAVMEAHRPPKPLEGPLHVVLCWTWPGKEIRRKTTRPDLDNLAKMALDAATKAGYWHDDAQIAMLTLAKYLGPIPGLAMSVAMMEEP